MKSDLFFNLAGVQQNKLYGITVQMADRAIVLRPKDQQAAPLVLSLPPFAKVVEELTPETAGLQDPVRVRFRHGDGIFVHVDDMIRAALQAEQEMHRLATDTHMSSQGISAKRQAIYAAGELPRSLAHSNAAILRIADQVDARGFELYRVPRPADVIEALEDREIRDGFFDLPQPEQMQMVARLNGNDLADRTLPALLRSPVPLGLPNDTQERMTEAWAERVQTRQPEQATRYKAEKANADWARAAARTVAGWAISRNLVGDKPTRFKAVRGIPGGPELFGMDEREIEYYSAAIPA